VISLKWFSSLVRWVLVYQVLLFRYLSLQGLNIVLHLHSFLKITRLISYSIFSLLFIIIFIFFAKILWILRNVILFVFWNKWMLILVSAWLHWIQTCSWLICHIRMARFRQRMKHVLLVESELILRNIPTIKLSTKLTPWVIYSI
jgi:hypothetical protein